MEPTEPTWQREGDTNRQLRALAEDRRAAGKRRVMMGAFWLVLGTVITWATYDSASSGDGGGHYVIMWGAIVYGIIDIVRGLAILSEG